MYYVDQDYCIDLGRQGENLVKTLEINVSAWLQTWPSASFAVKLLRCGDDEPYPISISYSADLSVVYVPLTSTETALAGSARMEISAYEDNVIKKSKIWACYVTASIDPDGSPVPGQGWTDAVIRAGSEAQRYALVAEQAAGEVEDAAAEVRQATSSGITAISSALNSAKSQITAAQGSAVNSVNSAKGNALNNIEEAKSDAVSNVSGAKGTALAEISSAKTDAVDAVDAKKAEGVQAVQDVMDTIPQDYSDLSDEVGDLKSALTAIQDISFTWQRGTINTSGTLQNNTARIRSLMHVFIGDFTAVIPSGMKLCTRIYDLNGTYETWTNWVTGTVRFHVTEAKRYRFVAGYEDDSDIDASAGSGIVITEERYTDSTLNMEGKAADAKTVGDALANASCGHGVISSGSYAIADFMENGWYLFYNAVELSDRPEQYPSGGFFLRVSKTGTVIEQELMPIDGGLYAYRIVGKAWTVINTAEPLAGKKIAIIGDSISDKANTTAATRYYDVVDAELGTVSTEYAMSGCGYKRKYNNGDTFYEQAAKIDTDTDLVLIFGSFNDHNVYDTEGLGEVTDKTTDTVLGCVYTTLQTIFTRAPKAAVGVILPTPWAQYPPYEKNTRQYAYINGIREIAGMYGVPVLDLYTGSNMRPWDATFRANYYTENGVQDSGTHPSSEGHKRFAPKVTAFVKDILG